MRSPFAPGTTSPHHSLHLLALDLGGRVRVVLAVILAFDLLDDALHLFGLLVPLGLRHLKLLAEELVVGLAVRTSQAVPESSVLAVVVVEVETMQRLALSVSNNWEVLLVHRVASRAVDDGALSNVFAVMDQDGPDVDKGKENDVGELLEREQEGEDVVGQRLRVTVERVESMASVRAGHDPLVVRLVQVLVDLGVVEPAVNPVDAEVGEHDEEGKLDDVVPHAGALLGLVIHFAVAAHFGDEEGRGEDGHDGEGAHRLSDFERNLVLEVFRVGESRLVENENVRERRKGKVDDDSEEPGAIGSAELIARR